MEGKPGGATEPAVDTVMRHASDILKNVDIERRIG